MVRSLSEQNCTPASEMARSSSEQNDTRNRVKWHKVCPRMNNVKGLRKRTNPLAILMEYEIKCTGISFKLFNLRFLR